MFGQISSIVNKGEGNIVMCNLANTYPREDPEPVPACFCSSRVPKYFPSYYKKCFISFS